jgi:anaerobic selenocysteine-containing dehydrogenase
MISRKNAAEHSIREGDPVLVYNDRGDLEGLARVTDTCGMA